MLFLSHVPLTFPTFSFELFEVPGKTAIGGGS